MQLPNEFMVLWKNAKGENCSKETNSLKVAQTLEMVNNGTIYIDTRYKAKVRLYWYLWRKKEYNT